MRFLVSVIANAIGFAVLAWLLSDAIEVTRPDSWSETLGGPTMANIAAYLVLGLFLGVVNGLIRPIVELLSIPLTCLTLGLFSLVISAGMLLLTAWLSGFTPVTLSFSSFFSAVLAAIGMWVVAGISSAVLEPVLVRDRGASQD